MQKELREYADLLDKAPRMGSDQDTPEGSRYIAVSDTLARQIASDLREFESSVVTFTEDVKQVDTRHREQAEQMREQMAHIDRALSRGITSRRAVLAESQEDDHS